MNDIISHLDHSTDTAAMLLHGALNHSEKRMRLPRPRWTDEEVALLVEHYPTGGQNAVAAAIPSKTIAGIQKKAKSLGIRAPGKPKYVQRFSTTQFIDDAISRYYTGKPHKGGIAALAHQINRPARWVSHRGRQLGVVPPRFRENAWTQAETDLLRKNAWKVPQTISVIFAKNGFRRNAQSIRMRLQRVKFDRTDDDRYTGNGLAALMGVRVSVVTGWIQKGWLKASTRGTTRDHDIFQIHRNSVRRFIIENVGAVDLRRVDKFWFVELVAGQS